MLVHKHMNDQLQVKNKIYYNDFRQIIFYKCEYSLVIA